MFTVTTILKTFLDDQQIGVATGFFYVHNDKLYIVTCKHVIYGNNFGQNTQAPVAQVNKLKLNLHTNIQNSTQNEEVTVNLINNGNRIRLEHQYTDVDVILVPITIDRTRYVISNVDTTLLNYENLVIPDFERIFIFGYPFGWFDQFNNLPIVRTGNLASPFQVPFQGKPIMLGDVITHEGMSVQYSWY